MAISEKIGSVTANYAGDALKFGLVGLAGVELAQGKILAAAAWGTLGVYYAVRDHRNIEGNVRNIATLSEWDSIRAHGRGVVEGRSRVLQTIEKLAEAQFHPEEPIYTPLDGSSPINTPIELMESLGGDVNGISMRVELVLRHAKKREEGKLTTAENETLRRALTLLRLAHIGEGDLSKEQRRRYYEISDKVSRYEYNTRKAASNI